MKTNFAILTLGLALFSNNANAEAAAQSLPPLPTSPNYSYQTPAVQIPAYQPPIYQAPTIQAQIQSELPEIAPATNNESNPFGLTSPSIQVGVPNYQPVPQMPQAPVVQVAPMQLPPVPQVQQPVVYAPAPQVYAPQVQVQQPVIYQAPAVPAPQTYVPQVAIQAPQVQAPVVAAPAVQPSIHAQSTQKPAHVSEVKNNKYDIASVSSTYPETTSKLPKTASKVITKDAWRQIEFVPLTNGTYLTEQIKELIKFKQTNWNGTNFNDSMIREEAPTTFVQSNFSEKSLPKSSKTALLINGEVVKNGFSYGDYKTSWFIYGNTDGNGKVLNLAVSPDYKAPSKNFIKNLQKLAGNEFAIVDWYKDTIVDTRTESSIADWAQIYKESEVAK